NESNREENITMIKRLAEDLCYLPIFSVEELLSILDKISKIKQYALSPLCDEETKFLITRTFACNMETFIFEHVRDRLKRAIEEKDQSLPQLFTFINILLGSSFPEFLIEEDKGKSVLDNLLLLERSMLREI